MAELTLDILGTSFTITTDEEKAYLRKVMAKYRAAVATTQNISGIEDPLNVAVLTGFILCDELNKAEQQLENESIEINRRTMKLISKLDKALKTYTGADECPTANPCARAKSEGTYGGE